METSWWPPLPNREGLNLVSEPLRVLSIGLGWVATNRHLPVMAASQDFHVVGVADRRQDRAETVARKFRIPRHYGDPRLAEQDGLAENPWLDEVEAVVIGASPFAHYALAKSALRAGKHVLTEKPFAMTPEEGEELVSLARELGLTLAVVHNFQFARSTRRLLRDIQSGRIGKIRSVTGVVFGNPRRRLPEWYQELPLGLFYDESPHLYYLLRAVLPGPLQAIRCDVIPSADGHATPAQLSQWFRVTDADGSTIPVHLSMNFESPLSEWHLQVHGEHAFADVDIFRDIYMRILNDGSHTARTILRSSLSTTLQHWGQHLPCGLRHFRGRMWYGNEEVFRRFAEAVRLGQQPEGIGPEDALSILKMQHNAIDSSRSLIAPPACTDGEE